MPLVDTGPYTFPYLRHEAPINESTRKIREMFKVDEETGYPEHYKWRNMAKIGPRYQPQDLFKYIGHHEPERDVSTQVFCIGSSIVGSILGHCLVAFMMKRSALQKIYWIPVNATAVSYLFLWLHDVALKRQNMKNQVYIDYMQKHPERFGEIYRPKIRECMWLYVPTR